MRYRLRFVSFCACLSLFAHSARTQPQSARPVRAEGAFGSRGSAQAPITILVFSDFESFPSPRPARPLPQAPRRVRAEGVFGSRGPAQAPITILVFSDFESFPCARSASVLAGILGENRDVRLIFKHAPAATNPNALPAHEAALAAGAYRESTRL